MSEFTAVNIRVRSDELDAIDEYRRAQKAPPSRAKAVEQLMLAVKATDAMAARLGAEKPA